LDATSLWLHKLVPNDDVVLSLDRRKEMPRYILTGDILRAAKVSVEADSQEEAIQKAEDGDFTIYEEYHGTDGFSFDGDDDHIEVEG
jgi:hypothetical protein